MIPLLMIPFLMLGFVVVLGSVFEIIQSVENRRAEIREQIVIAERFSISDE